MGCQEETSEEMCGRGSLSDYRAPVNQKDLDINYRLLDNDEHHWDCNIRSRNGALSPGDKKDSGSSDEWLYNGNTVNLNRFQRFHPGGTLPLKNLKGRDLEPSMESSHHSSEAYYLLRDFYNGNSEEDIVDWSKPMLSQVGSLGPLYTSWVWSPVDRPLRLFQSNLLEKLTRTNWKQVIGVWIPVITIALILSYIDAPYHNFRTKILYVVVSLVCGMSVWPLLEYSIHRWLFHMQPPKNSALLITIHFGLHGLHHKVPFDEGRLLFPPGPCSVMALALYHIYTRLFPWWIAMAFFSGTMLGYLIYDLIHYYLHHGNPKDGSYLYYMKRYHNQHHFAQQDKGFGISSDFWDNAFDTTVRLKKLLKPLSWE